MAQNVRIQWNGDAVKAAVLAACEIEVNQTAEIILADAVNNCPTESIESAEKQQGTKQGKTYGVKSGAAKKSGRIVKFKKDGVVGAYVKFGGRGYIVDGVDTFFVRFIELGTPGTVFRTQKGYWGNNTRHKRGRIAKIMRRKGKVRMTRVAVESKPFLRTSAKKAKRGHYKRIRKALPT